MTNSSIDISIVVVSYRCLDVLRMSLVALKRAIAGVNAEVILVDNASSDGTIQYVRENFKWVEAIESAENVGFSKANNIALEKCSGRVVLLLNPDTIVSQQFIDGIVSHFDANPDSGAVGVQMINGYGDYLKESKRGYPDVKTSFFKITGLWRLAPKSSKLNNYYLGRYDRDSICESPVLSGACMAFTHQQMQKVGVFDPSYFMYGEDIDLSWRMHCASAGNVYRGDLKIIHFKGVSTPRKLKYIYSFYNAMVKFAKVHENKKHNLLVNTIVSLGVYFGLVLASAKCLILRLFDNVKPLVLPHKIALVSTNPESKAALLQRYNVDATLVTLVDLERSDLSSYDGILFDIDGDIDATINYMSKHNVGRIYGFYSSAEQLAFVYQNNGCRELMCR